MAVAIDEYALPTGLTIAKYNGEMSDMAVASDGSLWMTGLGEGSVWRRTSDGVISKVEEAAGIARPSKLLPGVDGSMWVVSSSDGEIESQLTLLNSDHPVSVKLDGFLGRPTLGGDGDVWASLYVVTGYTSENDVVRITPTGDVTTFQPPDPSVQPWIFSTATDGTVWFAGTSDHHIGTISHDGTFTVYRTPDNGWIWALAPRPDGAMAFENGAVVGRVSADGKMTVLPIPPDFISTIDSIAPGADGSVWYASSNDQIIRLLPDGATEAYPTPTPTTNPATLISDGQGEFWFLELGTNSLGHLTPGLDEPPISIEPFHVSGTEGTLTADLPVAHFTTTDITAAAGDFLARIDLTRFQGSTIGVVRDDGEGGFTVYAPKGLAIQSYSRSISVTIMDRRHHNLTGTSSTVTYPVSFAPVPLVVSPESITTQTYAAFTGTVATFTAADLPREDFFGGIDWGDGSYTYNFDLAIHNDGGGHYTVSAPKHTYTKSGTYAVGVTIDGTSVGSAISTATVTPSPLGTWTNNAGDATIITPAYMRSDYQASVYFNDFTTVLPGLYEGAYKANIDWGDGTISTGTIDVNYQPGQYSKPSSYSVRGSHNYTQLGVHTITITVSTANANPDLLPISTSRTVNVVPTVTPAYLPAIVSTNGVFSGEVGVFSFADPSASIDGYMVNIDWGDNSHSPGTIVAGDSPGSYRILGSHTYDKPGDYEAFSAVRWTWAPVEYSLTHILVTAPAVRLLTPLSPEIHQESPDPVKIATFTTATEDVAADYTSLVSLPDGSTFASKVVQVGPTSFDVWILGPYRLGHVPLNVQVATIGGETTTIGTSADIIPAPVTLSVVPFRSVPGTNGDLLPYLNGLAHYHTASPITDSSTGGYRVTITSDDGLPWEVIPLGQDTDYSVTARHRFPTSPQGSTESFTVHVDYVLFDGSILPGVSVQSTAYIDPVPSTFTLVGSNGLTAIAGSAVSGIVATIVDPGVTSLSEYSATVDWGDGKTSAGEISLDGTNIIVTASHLYASQGVKPYGVIVEKAGLATKTTTGTLTILAPTIIAVAPRQILLGQPVLSKSGTLQVQLDELSASDRKRAADKANDILIARGKDGKFDTPDDVVVKIKTFAYNPKTHRLTITPKGHFTRLAQFRLVTSIIFS